MSLTFPLIDQAITRFERQSAILSEIGMLRQVSVAS